MASVRHKAYTAAIASVLTTELNGLVNATVSAASAALDNGTNLDMFADLTMTVGLQALARTGNPTVSVYIIQAVDGVNYDRVNTSTAEPVAVFTYDLATDLTQSTRRDIPIPPGLYKYFLVNSTGRDFPATGNLLEHRMHSVESV